MDRTVHNITTWKCSCSSENPLRFSRCQACAKPMPEEVKLKIYAGELKAQRAVFWRLYREKSGSRLQTLEKGLQKGQKAAAPVLLALGISLLAAYVSVGKEEIPVNLMENRFHMAERAQQGISGVPKHLKGLKAVPNLLVDMVAAEEEKVSEAVAELFKSLMDLREERKAVPEKVEHMVEKVKELREKMERVI